MQEKQKCGNQAQIESANQKRSIYTKPTKSQIREMPNRRGAKKEACQIAEMCGGR